MKREYKVLIRGMGIGVIITALLFYCVFTFSIPKESTLSNEEIIEKAKDLGMIFITNIENGNDSIVEDELQMKTNSDKNIDTDIDIKLDDILDTESNTDQ